MTNTELDRLVAEKVMCHPDGRTDNDNGILYHERFNEYLTTDGRDEDFSPSTNMAHAWMVVEEMMGQGWSFDTVISPDTDAYADFYHRLVNGFEIDNHEKEGRTIGESICHAALAAVGVEVEP